MNKSNYKLCDKIIPASYVRQGLEARKVLENHIMQLLEQACTYVYCITCAHCAFFSCTRRTFCIGGEKSVGTEHLQIALKVTEIGRISVVRPMYVSDQFVDGKLQLTH